MAVVACSVFALWARSGLVGAGGADQSKYIGTQFVSFTINTFGGLADKGECEGRQVDTAGMCYLGNKANLTEDVAHRLSIVMEVLDRIQEDMNATKPVMDHRDDVLKIVMLPEFFLRGPDGAFSLTELLEDGLLIEVADVVRNRIEIQEFNDFLFVFGTVIAAQSPDDPRKPWDHEGGTGDILYFNFAPVYKGGPTHKHRFLVTKKYVSTIDFLNRTNLPNPSFSGIREYSYVPRVIRDLLEERETQLVEDNLIQLDGLRIGLEICLDHRKGALWENLQKKYHGELVDVQLISSAGMSIEAGPNPVVPNGVVYLTDGGASSGACLRSDSEKFDPDRVCRKLGKNSLKSLPLGTTGYSSFFTISTCIDVVDRELLYGYYSLHQPQGCANTLKTYGIDVMDSYEEYLPSIEIYPTVLLPRNTY